MGKVIFYCVLFFSLLFFSSVATAQVLMTTSSNGTEKTSFFTNETIYITANNITNVSQSVNIYLIIHNASLANQTVLQSSSPIGPVNFTTNSSGGIGVSAFWSPNLIPGTYDLIVDVNKNNLFDLGNCGSGGDCNYSAGGNGIVVTRAPIPTLTFSVGPMSPPAHTYSYDPSNLNNIMLQIKVVGDIAEAVQIPYFDFIPSGSGDDKNGISIVKMFEDSNGNGVVDQGETLVAYGQYFGDDGVLRMDLASNPFRIPANATVYLLIQYTMGSGVASGQTFSTQLVSVTASGVDTKEKAVIRGLPVTSAVKTISGMQTTTTTASPTTTITTTIPEDLCSKDSDCGSSTCSNGKQVSPVCKFDSQKGIKTCSTTTTSVGCCPGEKCGFDFNNVFLLIAVAVIAFMLPAVYFFFIRKPKPQPEFYSGP